jgi:hypothetical protein
VLRKITSCAKFGLNDEEVDDEEDEDVARRGELSRIDWRNEGYYGIKEGDDSPNDRVHVQKRKLDESQGVY